MENYFLVKIQDSYLILGIQQKQISKRFCIIQQAKKKIIIIIHYTQIKPIFIKAISCTMYNKIPASQLSPTHPLTCFAFVIPHVTHTHKPKTKHVHNQHLQLNSQKHFSALPSGVHTPQTTHTVFQRLSHTQLSFRYMYAILLHTSCPHNDRHTHNLSPLHLLHHKTHTYCTGV